MKQIINDNHVWSFLCSWHCFEISYAKWDPLSEQLQGFMLRGAITVSRKHGSQFCMYIGPVFWTCFLWCWSMQGALNMSTTMTNNPVVFHSVIHLHDNGRSLSTKAARLLFVKCRQKLFCHCINLSIQNFKIISVEIALCPTLFHRNNPLIFQQCHSIISLRYSTRFR